MLPFYGPSADPLPARHDEHRPPERPQRPCGIASNDQQVCRRTADECAERSHPKLPSGLRRGRRQNLGGRHPELLHQAELFDVQRCGNLRDVGAIEKPTAGLDERTPIRQEIRTLSPEEQTSAMKRAYDGNAALGDGSELVAGDRDTRHVRELVDAAGKRQRNALPFNGVGSDESPVSVRRRDNRAHLVDAEHGKRTTAHVGEEGDLDDRGALRNERIHFRRGFLD
jgi:hypothetical protein